ncbi:MAG: DNA polymerase domain-containing protein [Chloroflexota bacterium]
MARVERTGWLMDVYTRPGGELVCWLLSEDGQRWLLPMDFPVTFYAAGSSAVLRQAWRFLQGRGVHLSRQVRRDLFHGERIVLAVTVDLPGRLAEVHRRLAQTFPLLDYYDADLPLAVRFVARTQVPLLGRCSFETDGQRLLGLQPLESAWEMQPLLPPLRVMEIECEANPALHPPQEITIRCDRRCFRFTVQPLRAFLANLQALLGNYDPDIIVTRYGDTWLFPFLGEHAPSFNPNRDEQMKVEYRRERSLFAYGQVLYRGAQALLFGRWHIDRCNAALFSEIGLMGALEMARVTGMGVQEAIRKSPGAGITAMQMQTALRDGVLIPVVKQQAESTRTLANLIRHDRGGMVYQPLVGVHHHVAELDFASMYPAIMVRYNISPETLNKNDAPAGLIPRTLQPLLVKRLALKQYLHTLDRRDSRVSDLKARQTALKWLLVVCFGYLGYKNARFGRVESHEAVTAISRELLLQAKENAEEMGFSVLHMYVDSLFVKREGVRGEADFLPLVETIQTETGIGVTLEGVYRWLVFLPARRDQRIPVANRYFGVFEDGTLKYRGVALRRHDTCPYVARTQLDILGCLAQADDPRERWKEAWALVNQRLRSLQRRQAAVEGLQMAVKLSRDPQAFRRPSAAAQAARQLQAEGVAVRAGMRLFFWYTRQGVSITPPNADDLDWERYARLVFRAATEILDILQPSRPVRQFHLPLCRR